MIKMLKEHIEKASEVVLLGHRNPDGDAMGATLAMCGVLRKMNKRATVLVPNKFPDNLACMSGADEVVVYEGDEEKAKATLESADFLMVMDFNSFSRLGDLEVLMPDIPCAMVDHHPYPGIDTPMLFSDTSVSSTCELLTNIIYDMGMDEYVDEAIATALFVGILTDTGRFNHNSSKPRTYRMVANLMEKGVDKDGVIDRVFDCYTEQRMRLMGFVLNEKMQLFPEQELAIVALSMEEKNRFDYKQGDSEGLVNLPLSIDGINKSVFMQEHDDMVRMSLRSKGDRPINKIASEHFEGGGHANAAGASSFLSLAETEAKVKGIFGV